MAKKVSFKDITFSGNWYIEKAIQGYDGKCRITARTKYHIPDGINFYQEWLSIKYVNRIRAEKGYTKIQDAWYWHC